MIRKLTFAAVLAALPFSALAQGTQVALGGLQQQDPDAPVEVTADALSVNQTDGTAQYSGNVLVVQGEMRLAAPRVLVVYSEEAGKIERFEATGGVTMISGQEAAEADRADYNLVQNTIVMTGDVLLTQGNSAMASEKMIVNLVDGTASLSGRVRTVLQRSTEGE